MGISMKKYYGNNNFHQSAIVITDIVTKAK